MIHSLSVEQRITLQLKEKTDAELLEIYKRINGVNQLKTEFADLLHAELNRRAQEKIEKETEEIKRLEAISEKDMSLSERAIHITKIKDAYWRRMMAMRTPEEILKGVCAPG